MNWDSPDTVAGFSRSAPNPVLMRFAAAELRRGGRRALDIGAGAARNAVPLAQQGWDVLALDQSWPMMAAAAGRSLVGAVRDRVSVVLAPMDRLPLRDRSVNLVIAHGIWNLARSSAEFRTAVREAARVSKPGAALFLFTFSRNTLPPDATPVSGEPFVFIQFSGQPQCFLTAQQLLDELAKAGFTPDPGVPLTEYNRRPHGALRAGGPPVIYECAFRYAGGATPIPIPL